MVYRRMKKYAKKQAKRFGRYLKKRYVKRGGLRFGRIARDVKMLKHIINSEKKQTEFTTTSQLVGQWGGTGSQSGHNNFDIIPAIFKGVEYNNRIGNSIKLVGAHFKLQLRTQNAVVNPIKVKFIIYSHKTDTLDATRTAAYPGELFDTNDFNNTTIDMYSSRNNDYFRDFIIHRTHTCYLKGDTAGTGTAQTQLVSKSFGIKWKKGHYLKWGPNTSTFIVNGNLFCLAICDFGNVATAASPDSQAASTGATFNLHTQYYFYDN